MIVEFFFTEYLIILIIEVNLFNYNSCKFVTIVLNDLLYLSDNHIIINNTNEFFFLTENIFNLITLLGFYSIVAKFKSKLY